MLGTYGNFGSPFKILNLYVDAGNNFCMSTTLKSLPTGYSKNATVTFDLSADKVLWTGHGLAAGVEVLFMSTGALPWGITQGLLYYVNHHVHVSVANSSSLYDDNSPWNIGFTVGLPDRNAPEATLPVLRKGMRGYYVTTMQTLLGFTGKDVDGISAS
jgi:hypothetical protein